jgi:hypothetical protein
MADPAIPGEHHVSRYCKPTSLRADSTPSGVAFRLRNRNEPFLSVNWLEYANPGSRSEQIAEVRRCFVEKGFRTASTGIFAVLKVERVVSHVFIVSGHKLRAVHRPEDRDPSHSGLLGYTYSDEDDLIADLIAEKVIETHSAKV